MLERGTAAKYASAVFYRHQNDFDVYIEDTAPGYEKIFSSLLSRAISTRISISRVFPLGSRNKVIEAAKQDLNLSPNRRRAVFIIDGDLYILCGEREELPSNVVSLPRYCIENFLWDENALVEVMDEEDVASEEEQLRLKLDFGGWRARSQEGLKKLFTIFAAAHKLRSGIPTLARGSKSICASHDGEIDAGKIDAIHSQIYLELAEKYGTVVVEYVLRLIESRIDPSICFISTYVSGKDFALPFAIQKIRSITKTKTHNINLKLRLSKKCSLTPLIPVIEKISGVINCSDIIPTS